MHSPILITGCSSGLGAAAAQALLERGHDVYATARDIATIEHLRSRGARTLELDVTNEDSMRAAVAAVEAEHGAVGTLINNAGWGAYGAVENVSIETARANFDTNVLGLGRLTQLVLPGMRAAGRGRIINVSSMVGRVSLPFGGWYQATKFAVEALSDALRFEVARQGIDVVLIEPGPIRTRFAARVESEYSASVDSPYARDEAVHNAMFASLLEGRASATATAAAQTFVRAVEARRPRHRYVITAYGQVMVQIRRLLGSRFTDTMLRRMVDREARRVPADAPVVQLPS